MIKIDNLSVYIDQKPLVKSINFNINQGEIFALAGESGSGKSLTALSIANLLKFTGNFNITGRVEYNGQNLLEKSERELQKIRGNEIGIIFQDPQTSLNPLHTIYKQIAEVLKLHNVYKEKDIPKRVLELLDLVELDALQNRLGAYPHELSGGQRQRVMIAMAIANKPKLLIADEPTTALDVTVQKEILELIRNLQKELQMSVLLITHDMGIIKNYADRVAIMKNGEIIESGVVAEIFKNPQQEYTEFLIHTEPVRTRGYKTFNNDNVILETKDLNIFYKKKAGFFNLFNNYFAAVKNAELKLNNTQNIGIVGESGSGKSTLAKAILKLLKTEGKIILNGKNIVDMDQNDFRPLRRNIQIVYQDPFSSLNPRMTVEEIITEGLRAHDLIDANTDKKVDELLVQLGLDIEAKHKYPHEFSGGQRQRIGLARSLILEPKIIIFDEPTSALDLVTQKEILRILDEFQKNYELSYIFISHDLKVIKAISDYVIVMKDGNIVEENNVMELFDNPREEYTKKLLSASFL